MIATHNIEAVTFDKNLFAYKVLSYLFVSGFILTIYKIIKNNRRVMMADIKAEIKNEILNEKNSPYQRASAKR